MSFTEEERAAMKERAKEVKAARRGGKADEEPAVLEKIAEMADEDRVLAERIHALVKENAPELQPRLWYGMPAYANAEGKVVFALKNAGKFSQRYATLEFQDPAHLDDGDLWPVSFALKAWSPAVEQKVTEIVRAAVS